MNKLLILISFFTSASVFIACDKSGSDDPIPLPEACIEASDTIVQAGESVDFSSCTENASEIFWYIPGEDTIRQNQFSHTFKTPGVTDVTLIAKNEIGDISYAYAGVEVTGEEGKIFSSPDLENNYYPQDIVGTSDNGFLVTYRLWKSISDDETELRIVSFDSDIEFVNTYTLQYGGANPYYSNILNLSNGKIAVSWSDYISGYSGARSTIMNSDFSDANTFENEADEVGYYGIIEKDEVLYHYGFSGGHYDYGIYIRKTDLNGTFIEETTLSKEDSTLIPMRMISTDDGGFAIAGTMNTTTGTRDTGNELVFLIKTDSDLNILWERYFGDKDYYELIHGLFQDTEGLLLSYGYGSQLYFQKITNSGEDIDEKSIEAHFASQGGDMIDYGSGYLIVTDNILFKTDYQFNIVSTTSLNSRSEAIKIISRNDSGYAILMDREISHPDVNISPSNIYIVKLDANGEIEYFQE